MKKLILLFVLISVFGKGQQYMNVINIFPKNAVIPNPQIQNYSANNYINSAHFGDTLTALVYSTWNSTSSVPPSSLSIGLQIENTYAPCQFNWTLVKYATLSSMTTLTTGVNGTGYGFFKFQFVLKNFTCCNNSNGYSMYQFWVGGTSSPAYQSPIYFTVLPQLTTGIEEQELNNNSEAVYYDFMGNKIEPRKGELIIQQIGNRRKKVVIN